MYVWNKIWLFHFGIVIMHLVLCFLILNIAFLLKCLVYVFLFSILKRRKWFCHFVKYKKFSLDELLNKKECNTHLDRKLSIFFKPVLSLGRSWSMRDAPPPPTCWCTGPSHPHKSLSLPSIEGGLRRRGGIISVDLSLFVLLYNTNFMKELKFN